MPYTILMEDFVLVLPRKIYLIKNRNRNIKSELIQKVTIHKSWGVIKTEMVYTQVTCALSS